MKKTVLALSVGAIVLGATGAFLASQRSAQASAKPRQTPSVSVSLVSPSETAFARAIAATGTVAARDELLVGSDATGVRLVEVLVDVGSVVQKGQLLARGDDTQLQAQLAQQVAQVKQAQAEHVQALANEERAERLKEFFSVETVQTRRTAAATAAAKLDLARAQQRELEVKIAHTRVTAPSAGVISRKIATVGAVVQSGSELFRLIRDGELEWRAELPGHSLSRIEKNSEVRIFTDNGESIVARVRLVAPTIDSATRNGQVHVTLPKNVALKAGGHARGEILLGAAQALALPEAAVLARDGYPFVFTVGADSIARLTKIETGARQGGLVEVSGGLAGNVRVVTTGAGFVKDGDLVRVAPATAQKSGTGEKS